jgi:hypothetical protein
MAAVVALRLVYPVRLSIRATYSPIENLYLKAAQKPFTMAFHTLFMISVQKVVQSSDDPFKLNQLSRQKLLSDRKV